MRNHTNHDEEVFYESHNQIDVNFEGNIAAGKSSLLRALESNYVNVGIEWEPVDQWVNDEGCDLLALYNSNPYRYRHEFKLKVLATMSIPSYDQHRVNREAAVMYNQMLNILRPVYKRYIIYFRCDPQTAFNRNEQRQGSAHNKNIPIEVFQAVHNAYDTWLNRHVTNISNGPARVFAI